MSMQNSTVEIKNGKVVFSQEIIDYFENLRNEKTSEWIDKYFDVLSDENNLISEKYNIHHIRPCCTFKDKEHKNRKQSEKLANKFNGNLIKLSIYNHIFAHFYLWKIFNNRDSKEAFQRMCSQEEYVDNLTEDEIKEIARLKEKCAEKNRTDKEKKEIKRNHYQNNKEKYKEQSKKRYETHKTEILKKHKERYENNRKPRKNKEINKKEHERHSRICFDPIKEDYPTYGTLKLRKSKNKEKYKDVILKDCIIQPQS